MYANIVKKEKRKRKENQQQQYYDKNPQTTSNMYLTLNRENSTKTNKQ
jgi:hypothetical protein